MSSTSAEKAADGSANLHRDNAAERALRFLLFPAVLLVRGWLRVVAPHRPKD